MEREKEYRFKIEEEIVIARITDEDLEEWKKTLREGGLSNEEIDSILINLNRKYAEEKRPEIIKKKLAEKQKEYLEKYGRKLTANEKRYYTTMIEMFIDFDKFLEEEGMTKEEFHKLWRESKNEGEDKEEDETKNT